MKKCMLAPLAMVLVVPLWVNGQNAVGIGTAQPNSNAVLELVSTTNDQGLLVPRLTTSQRTDPGFLSNLSSVDNSLLVFDSDERIFYYWNDSQWMPLAASGGGQTQDLSLAGNELIITGNPAATAIDLSPYVQTLAFIKTGSTIEFSLSNGNTISVDVADGDNDATNELQDLASVLSQGGDAGGIAISNISDPSSAQDVATKNYVDLVNTDADPSNEIQDLQLVGNTLTITNHSSPTNIDLAPFAGVNTDNQTLSISGSDLSITGGNTVDLSGLTDADADPANEIQTISKAGSTVTLSDGGGSFTDDVDDADANPSNELQTISKVGSTVTLSNGGGAFTDEVDDADANATNELQTISKSGSTVTLSNGGGSFTDAVNDADASVLNEIQDLSLVGNNLTITNHGSPTTISFGDLGFLNQVSTSEITNNTITNVDISGSANIAGSKLQSTVMLEGENISLLNNNAGYLTSVTNADIVDVDPSKITQGGATDGQVLTWSTVGSSWGPATPDPGFNTLNYLGVGDGATLVQSALYNNGSYVGLNRTAPITGSSYFDVHAPTTGTNYGGMYVNSLSATGRPFIGYSLNGTPAAWTYVDGTNSRWSLNYGGDRLTVESTGDVGIGTVTPLAKLHTFNASNNTVYVESSGGNAQMVLDAGAGDPQLRYYEGGASSASIGWSSGGDYLYLFENGGTSLVARGNDVGIGTATPSEKLDVAGNINLSGTLNMSGTPVLSVAGTNNLLVGNNVGTGNTGSSNTMVGTNVGNVNTGPSNTFLGMNTGQDNTSGGANTFVGTSAGASNTTAQFNTMLGGAAGGATTTGGNNTFIGVYAGLTNTTGTNNTSLGANAGPSSGTITNSTALGMNAAIGQSYSMALGGSGVNAVRIGIGTPTPNSVIHVLGQSTANYDIKSPLLRLQSFNGFEMFYRYDGGLIISGAIGGNYEIDVTGDIAYTGSLFDISDARKKQDVQEITDALSRVRAVNGVTYRMIDHPETGFEFGVIAQELEVVFPELVKEGEDGYKRVDYLGLLAPMIEAIKELDQENKALRNRIDELEEDRSKLSKLEHEVKAIMDMLQTQASAK